MHQDNGHTPVTPDIEPEAPRHEREEAWAAAVFRSVEGRVKELDLTPSQRRIVRHAIIHAARRETLGQPEKYEVKELALEPLHEDRPARQRAAFRMVLGRRGDEGTMAALLCRTRAQLFIGRNGGVKFYDRTGRARRGFRHLHLAFHNL